MKKIISVLSLIILINCITTPKENKNTSNIKAGNEILPKGCKRIYINSNNVNCEGQISSLDFYNIKSNGLFFSLIESKNKITLDNFPFSLLYKEHIDFSKVTLFGGKNTMTIEILKKNKEKIKFNSGKKIELFHFYPKNFDKIYNFYKTNKNIKIKFIGRDGKSYIVPVSEQHRKDLIELVDYYRMLTHKSE